MHDFSQLEQDLSFWNIPLSEGQKEQLEQYYLLLTERNAQMNLTAIDAFPDFCRLHVVDSLALLRFLPEQISRETRGQKVADLGSGAGFPGMILKLFSPDWEVHLVETLGKRVLFLEEVRAAILPADKRIFIQKMRAEEAGRMPKLREQFSLVTARAVAELSVLLEYALPLLNVGGVFAAYKSRETDEEIEGAEHALEILGGRLLRTEDYALPNTDTARRLVFVEKVKATEEKYPRRAGMAKKRPL